MFSTAFGRLGVVALLRTLQGSTHKNWKTVLLVVGVFQFCAIVVQIGLTIGQCDPPEKLWYNAKPGNCNLIKTTRLYGVFAGSVGAFSDFFLALYPPALIVGPLQKMKPGLKVAICFVMGGGVVAGVAGCVKTVRSRVLLKTNLHWLTSFQAALYRVMHKPSNYATFALWALTEAWFIIIFGSLPTIRSVLVVFGEKIRDSFNSRSRSDARILNSDPAAIELTNKSMNSHVEPARPSTAYKSTSSRKHYEEDEIAFHDDFATGRPVSEKSMHDLSLHRQPSDLSRV